MAFGVSTEDVLRMELWVSEPSVSVAGAARLLFGSRWPSVSFDSSTDPAGNNPRTGGRLPKQKLYSLKFRERPEPVRQLASKARIRFDALQTELVNLNKNSVAATQAFTRALGIVTFTRRGRTHRSAGSAPFAKWIRRRVLLLADALPKASEVQTVRAKQRHWRMWHEDRKPPKWRHLGAQEQRQPLKWFRLHDPKRAVMRPPPPTTSGPSTSATRVSARLRTRLSSPYAAAAPHVTGR